MAQLPVQLFRHQLDMQLVKHIRPPTKKDCGKNVRKLKPIVTTRAVIEDTISEAHGLPALSEASLLKDKKTGATIPKEIKQSGERIKIKLQDPKHVRAFYRGQDRSKKKCWGAAKLIFKKAMGRAAKMVALAAAPITISAKIPAGKSALTVFPTISVKHNVCTMDENGDVTFGVKEYPPWVCRATRPLQTPGHSLAKPPHATRLRKLTGPPPPLR